MGRNTGLGGILPELERALAISGWMDPLDLEWLGEQACTHSRIVEVGSFIGRSTRVLADNTPGWVMAFDDWRGPRDASIKVTTEGSATAEYMQFDEFVEKKHVDLYWAFTHNLADAIDSGKVKVVKGNHADTSVLPVEFLRGSDEEKPDMVFIDGNHAYEDVKRDIDIWRYRIAKGGLLCGHDASFDGVMKALIECFGRWNQVPLTDIWSVNV